MERRKRERQKDWHTVRHESVHIRARMHIQSDPSACGSLAGQKNKKEIGGYSVCLAACVCTAYAWIDVLCMTCYAISMSKPAVWLHFYADSISVPFHFKFQALH